MKSLIRGWRGILLLLFSLLLFSVGIFMLCSDFAIGTYLLVFAWSAVFSIFIALCTKNHPVPILWMRGTDIKRTDTPAYCSVLKKPTLIFLLAISIPDVVFVYIYLLAERQFSGILTIWFAVCLIGYLIFTNHGLQKYEMSR